MSPGAKIFFVLAGAGGLFGVLAIAASKKAGAAPLPPKPGEGTVVVPPDNNQPPAVVEEPEPGFDRDSPFAVPGIQDAQEASRLLLRWWAAEGENLVRGDTDSDKPSVPNDFGSQAVDLNGTFGARTKAAAKAFQHYNGLTPEDGVLSNPLLLALRRWAQSQDLPPQQLPPGQSPLPPAPIVLPNPGAPPPFIPQPPSSAPPVLAPPVALPPMPPVVPLPLPPLSAPPQGQPDGSAPPLTSPPVVPLPPVLPLPPVVAPPLPAPPVAVPPVSDLPPPTAVSADTAAMVNALLTAEASAGWNKADPAVQAWQKVRPPLKVDGLFGPKTALTVAEQFGTVPIIRVWPSGSQKARALQDYRAALIEIANNTSDATRAAQLRVSAQREQGQGYGVARGKAPALPSSLVVKLAKVS